MAEREENEKILVDRGVAYVPDKISPDLIAALQTAYSRRWEVVREMDMSWVLDNRYKPNSGNYGKLDHRGMRSLMAQWVMEAMLIKEGGLVSIADLIFGRIDAGDGKRWTTANYRWERSQHSGLAIGRVIPGTDTPYETHLAEIDGLLSRGDEVVILDATIMERSTMDKKIGSILRRERWTVLNSAVTEALGALNLLSPQMRIRPLLACWSEHLNDLHSSMTRMVQEGGILMALPWETFSDLDDMTDALDKLRKGR